MEQIIRVKNFIVMDMVKEIIIIIAKYYYF